MSDNFLKLTPKEKEFYVKLIKYYTDHLVEPTREELSHYLKMSPQLCQYYISRLKKKGIKT